MKIVSIGGGPAGLYFGILMKKANPAHDVLVLERNRPDDTFGFGVVFSDATMAGLGEADAESYAEIRRRFAHWDDIDIHFGGRVIRSTGHGFAGLGRQDLLDILQRRAAEVGVRIEFQHDVIAADVDGIAAGADLVLGADGVNSLVRAHYAEAFRPRVDLRPNRFVWLGTTFPFPAFTFYFNQNQHGLFRVHAYRYAPDQSTFIVECTGETFARTALDPADEDAAVAYCETLFARELGGHRLLKNRSIWRQFPVIQNGRWSHRNVVLMGDAVHTAHFSIGSGTKLAMEDAIVLRDAVVRHPGDVPRALSAYEETRRPQVESLQRAALTSLSWFEDTERYMSLPPERFAVSLLTRSLRVTHENLKLRDPALVAAVDDLVAREAEAQSGVPVARAPLPPPMFTPYRLRDLVLPNRVVVSPMCQYSADDGTVDDWHLVHLGSRALGGAGLVIAEMTDVSREGRISPGCAGLYKPEHVPAWKRVTEFVHRHAHGRIALQLGHAGRKASTRRLWEGDNQPLASGGWPVMAASALPYFPSSPVPRAMTRADMDEVKADFVRSTHMAVQAGFDMIELHFAHGYLLASFLSPLLNRRDDEYGGALAGRLRYPLEILAAVRAVWPAERPLSVRISAVDWKDGGSTAADAVEIARALHAAGADIIDVSTGQTVPDEAPVFGRLYQTPFAERIRLETGVPTMTVGAISTWADVNSIIATGRADLCVLARAHLYDPYWTRHAAAEQGFALEWPDPYKSLVRYKPRFR